ncbi:hypothetical protein Taro_022585 [Colocasia esculenta]|uniref:Uncharacterized protein n=1 Tax=Colocasia esculenta TaxID=4460 RepID=A0A843V1Z5_COLES|nr:hypothetical protein [Colocasia esculenta]
MHDGHITQASKNIVNHTHENNKRKEVHAISRELQWYNQLVGHVGIHGQRRFTEALEKRSLVYRFRMTGRELPNSQERLPRRTLMYTKERSTKNAH